MNIGIDIDDTINNLSKTLIEYAVRYNKDKDIKHKINPNEWDFDKAFGWEEEHIKEFLDKYIAKVFIEAEPKKDAKEIIKKLKGEGNNIIFITARNEKDVENLYENTKLWLDKNGFIYDKIEINSDNKVDKCINNNIDIFVDDIVDNCITVKSKLNIPVYLFDSNYNKNHENTLDLKRVFSWYEVYNEIKG